VNVHWHCIVSNMERISKISSLPPLEKFLLTPVLLTCFFQVSGIFPNVLVVSYLQIQQTKKFEY